MLCAHCGNPVDPDQQCCSACGHEVAGTVSTAQAGADVPDRTVSTATSRKAIASLVLGFLFLLPPAAVLAIVLGYLSRRQIRRSNGRLKGDGMALAGLIMGYCGLGIAVLVVLLISSSNVDHFRIPDEGASPVGCLRTLNTAESVYKSAYPGVGFACSLSQLGPPAGAGSASSAAAGLIDSGLASGVKAGYKFTIGKCDTQKGVAVNYQWLAAPLTSSAGQRFFCTDASGVIKFSAKDDCLKNGTPI